jgi:hypothetical protein
MPSSKTIAQLYTEFEKALAAVEALKPYLESKEKQAEFDDEIMIAGNYCWRIVQAPANPADPIPEMLLKIAAAGWSTGGLGPSDNHTTLDKWTSKESAGDEPLSCLVSIREDLRAMQKSQKKA